MRYSATVGNPVTRRADSLWELPFSVVTTRVPGPRESGNIRCLDQERVRPSRYNRRALRGQQQQPRITDPGLLLHMPADRAVIGRPAATRRRRRAQGVAASAVIYPGTFRCYDPPTAPSRRVSTGAVSRSPRCRYGPARSGAGGCTGTGRRGAGGSEAIQPAHHHLGLDLLAQTTPRRILLARRRPRLIKAGPAARRADPPPKPLLAVRFKIGGSPFPRCFLTPSREFRAMLVPLFDRSVGRSRH
jgi:hypothetical protein